MDKVIHFLASALGAAALTWISRYHDPWYSDGWILNRSEWLLLAAVIALASVIASLSLRGLIAVVVLDLIAAVAFAVLYAQSNQNEPWPLVTWVVHLIVFALAVGIIAGLVRLLFLWWRRLPPSTAAGAP